jgi:methylitaconate Delta-isomerase
MRGGTSRGVFFQAHALPTDRRLIEQVLLDVFGSPDVRQINGLGGATSQTSKAAIIGPATRPDADVDYTFAQVSVTDSLVDWGGNCGNLSAAVGPYALDHQLVPVDGDVATVRIHNTNTGKVIVASVPVRGGRAAVTGNYVIPGVPGTGARILLEFTEPAGSVTGKLLPTGRPRDEIILADGRRLSVSVVDAGNPGVFLLADEVGMSGVELPAEIEARTDVTETLEEVRGIVAEWLGIVTDRALATSSSPGLPKVGFVAPPGEYVTSSGDQLSADAMDLSGRLMSMQTAHRSYMVTGAICTAAAALIEGSVVHQVARPAHARPERDTIRIGHPYGVMEAVARADVSNGETHISSVAVGRTARHILDGVVWVLGERLDANGADAEHQAA